VVTCPPPARDLEASDLHGLGTEGTYRATPVASLAGESSVASVAVSDTDATTYGIVAGR
jgi:hypothetical protein